MEISRSAGVFRVPGSVIVARTGGADRRIARLDGHAEAPAETGAGSLLSACVFDHRKLD
jgi:hypothetical protein